MYTFRIDVESWVHGEGSIEVTTPLQESVVSFAISDGEEAAGADLTPDQARELGWALIKAAGLVEEASRI